MVGSRNSLAPISVRTKQPSTLIRMTAALFFRHDADLQDSDFQLTGHMEMSAQVFPKLFDDFGEMFEKALAE